MLLVPVCAPLSTWHHEYCRDGTPDSTHLLYTGVSSREADQPARRRGTDGRWSDRHRCPCRTPGGHVMAEEGENRTAQRSLLELQRALLYDDLAGTSWGRAGHRRHIRVE